VQIVQDISSRILQIPVKMTYLAGQMTERISQKHFKTITIYNINGSYFNTSSERLQCPKLSKRNDPGWTTLGIAFAEFLRLNEIIESYINNQKSPLFCVALYKEL